MPIDIEQSYRRYGPMALRRCRRLLNNEAEANDAMHDVFVQLLRHQDRLEERALSSLIFRMATNVSLNRIRSRRRRPEDPDGDLLFRIASSDDTEGRLLSRFRLRSLFAGERTSTQVLAVLRLLDGMTLEEVAETAGLSVSGVRKRLRTLKKRLVELEELDDTR